MRDNTRDIAVIVTEADRALLAALARGGKDEVVARRLGVSVRTLRRRLFDLMQRLGATSRFQIGAKAAQAGLLPYDPWKEPDRHDERRDAADELTRMTQDMGLF